MKRKPQRRYTGAKTRPRNRKAAKNSRLKYIVIAVCVALFLIAGYKYRHGFLYYLGFKTDKTIESLSGKKGRLGNVRLYEIVSQNKDKVFGIDVSHYQGKINWDKVSNSNDHLPIGFVFVRATAGKDKTDRTFKTNFGQAKANGFITGAYHYYRPDENSLEQARNFIKTVKLAKGDLPPVLDIEQIPDEQSIDNLKTGLKRWLNTVQKHYGVKPIIYSGDSFYTDFLKKEFKGYKLWIANYSFFEDEIRKEWLFWQFTDKASVKGIIGYTDVNIFNGSLSNLEELCIK